jgi:hypothetical protein
MAEQNIFRLHPSDTVDRRRYSTHESAPLLFSMNISNSGKTAFVNVDWLVENVLLNIIVINGVTGIIDLRPRPVFSRPKFRHKKVLSYLYEHNIRYFECALYASSNQARANRSLNLEILTALSSVVDHGLTICIYDESARSLGWMDDIRNVLRRFPSYTELHPSSLVGLRPERKDAGID